MLSPQQIQEARTKLGPPPSIGGQAQGSTMVKQGWDSIKFPSEKPVEQKQPGFFQRVGQDISQRAENVGESADLYGAGKQSLPEAAFQMVGQSVAGLGDIGMEAVKSILPKKVKEPIKQAVTSVAQTAPVQSAMESYNIWKEQHPRAAKNLEATVDIASILPAEKVIGAGVKVIGKSAEVGSNIGAKVAEKTITPVVNKIFPKASADELVGQITRGTKKEIEQSKNALSLINTKNIKTHEELTDVVNQKISEIARKQDELFSAPTVLQTRKLSELGKTTIVGGENVTQNSAKDALDHLKEWYSNTKDSYNLARINSVIKKAETQGISTQEINQIAREYNTEVASKAFSKTGEPLTSVSKVASENTRKGVKDTARQLLAPNLKKASEILDKNMSDLMTLKRLSTKMSAGVQQLTNKIQKRGLIESIARKVGQTVDTLTMHGTSGFLKSLLQSNVGDKVMNHLDVQRILSKNLNKINKLIDKGSDKEIMDFIDEVIKARPDIKGLLPAAGQTTRKAIPLESKGILSSQAKLKEPAGRAIPSTQITPGNIGRSRIQTTGNFTPAPKPSTEGVFKATPRRK